MYRLSVKGTFDAAHHLPGYPGNCQRCHGHSWLVTVTLAGYKLDRGMLLDFRDIKVPLKEILQKFDHTDLNDFISMPTAENLARVIFDNLFNTTIGNYLESVSVKEGYGGEATYYPD